MILQLLPLSVVWLAWLVFRRKAWMEGRRRFEGQPRSRRILLSIGAVILGPAMLLSGLVLLNASIGLEGDIAPVGLLLVAILGIGFIELQMVAVSITGSLVADSVTRSERPPSIMKEEDES